MVSGGAVGGPVGGVVGSVVISGGAVGGQFGGLVGGEVSAEFGGEVLVVWLTSLAIILMLDVFRASQTPWVAGAEKMEPWL